MFRLAIISAFVMAVACMSDESDLHYNREREAMVKSQLMARGVRDERVLNAMRTVPRHLFVPMAFRGESYSDCPLPISNNQTISQPYIVAVMTELACIAQDDKVLEVGTGSGYQAAVLSELCDSVFSIEIVASLAKEAMEILDSLDYRDVQVKIGDGFAGWAEHAPYDAIIVTCAPVEVPKPLIDQLAEGGRLVIPVGDDWQDLRLITKSNGVVHDSSIFSVRFVPMTGPGVDSAGDSK